MANRQLSHHVAPKGQKTGMHAFPTQGVQAKDGNGPGRDKKGEEKAHFLKVLLLILLPICHYVHFRPPGGPLAHNQRSETVLTASLMQNSTNGHWWTVKTLQTPVASHLHVYLCYPGHVLPVLKGTVVSLRLTTARAPGCRDRPLPGFSLGQQDDLAVLITCLLFFYCLLLLPGPLSAIKRNHFSLLFSEIEMTRQCTKCCQWGISAVAQLTWCRRNSSICEPFSSQASLKKAASSIGRVGMGCPERRCSLPEAWAGVLLICLCVSTLPAHMPRHRSGV